MCWPRPTWEVAPVGDSPVSGGMEAVVVPGGQVNDAVVELVPFSGDQLAPEGATGGGCGADTNQALRQALDATQHGACVQPGHWLQGGLKLRAE